MNANRAASPLTWPKRSLAATVAALGTCFGLHTVAQPVLEAPFTQITTGPVVSPSALWITPAWGDYDNDDWVELFVANFASGGRHGLFHNNQDGTFTRITTGP